MTDFDRLQRVHGSWSDATFGERPATGPINHLKKEVQELSDAPDDIVEYADCILLFMDAARIAGFTMSDIFGAAEQKLEVNKKRKWGPVKNGMAEHIRDGEDT